MTLHKSRAGSLQFWPRKRAAKLLPSVNWSVLKSEKPGLLGAICYKAGMARALARDLTADSMTKGKQIILPITLLECPPMRIASVRFYKNGIVATEVLTDISDKLLKKKLKLPKQLKKSSELLAEIEPKLGEFEDLRILVYSIARLAGKKKTPDLAEIGLSGDINEKFNFVKDRVDKDINFSDVFSANAVADARGLTTGRGLQGPVKRFGIHLKAHKSEKGLRRPGTLGPWTPSRVTFRVPMAGQEGFFTREVWNLKIIGLGSAEKINLIFPGYGKINTNYAIIKGSVQGPPKRPLIFTMPLRITRKTAKKNYEMIEVLK
jgi:large subunit ribosomal protein L3